MQKTKLLLVMPLLLSPFVYAQDKSQKPVLKLEDTIRGNKEQPQVLTIVPWQLPVHKRIDEVTLLQPLVDRLPPIERDSLLRNMQIFKENIQPQIAEEGANE